MKKRNVFLMTALIAMVCITSCGVFKKGSDNNIKIKEWKAGGYKLTGGYSTFTMERLLEIHNGKITSDINRFVPIEGSATADELSSAKMFAANDAAIQYAQRAGSALQGSIMRQAAKLSDETRTRIVAAFTQKISNYIVPYMKESFGLERTRGRNVEVLFYYIVGEEDAIAVSNKALEEINKEQAVGLEINNYVEDTVR
jgi:hypothetical protein